MTDAAASSEPEGDRRLRAWQALADELSPAKSLARIDTAAGRVLGNVTVVGTLLTGLGLLAAGLPSTSDAAGNFALAAVVAAVLAVGCALAAQILTIRRGLNTNNLAEVKEWYQGQFRRRAYPARAATVLLLAAILFAGGAAAVAVLERERPRLTLSVSQIDPAPPAAAGASLTVDVTFRAPGAGSPATVLVTATATGGTVVLARAALTPDVDGIATRTLTIGRVPADAVVEVTATGGLRQCRASWDVDTADPPEVVCDARGTG